MALLRSQWTHFHDSGLPQDVSTNTLYFDVAALLPAAYDLLQANMFTFWDTVTANGTRLAAALSSTMSGAWRNVLYSMADPEPRVPVATYNGTYAVGPSAMPAEVSLVLSFQGDPVSGVPQARRRGRMYLGPITQSTVIQDSTTGRPTSAVCIGLGQAATRLVNDCEADNIEWQVWSPTSSAVARITNGWVDNAFDTQRRRGLAATLRNAWTE